MKPCTSPLVVWTINPSLQKVVGKITATKASENEVHMVSKNALDLPPDADFGPWNKSPKHESKTIYIINESSSMNPGG